MADQGTQLHHAASSSNLEVLECGFRQGMDVNQRLSIGDTPLMVAIRDQDNNRIVTSLIDNGADVHINSQTTSSPHRRIFAKL